MYIICTCCYVSTMLCQSYYDMLEDAFFLLVLRTDLVAINPVGLCCLLDFILVQGQGNFLKLNL